MADVSKIFKPRRGTASIMAGTKKSTVLASGELFVEVPNTGVGTGASKIKIGDGTTAYSSLPYALGDTSNDKINFSSNTSTTVAAALNSVVTGASLKNIVAGLKQAISLCNTSITQLNDDIGGFKFGISADGKGQYKAPGDANWNPFLTKYNNMILLSKTMYTKATDINISGLLDYNYILFYSVMEQYKVITGTKVDIDTLRSSTSLKNFKVYSADASTTIYYKYINDNTLQFYSANPQRINHIFGLYEIDAV